MPPALDGQNILIKCVAVNSSIYSGCYQQTPVLLTRREKILFRESIPRARVLSITQTRKKRKWKGEFLMFSSTLCLGSSILTEMALAEETTFEITVRKGGWGFAEMLMNQVKIREVVPVHKYTAGRRYQKIWGNE